MIRMNLVALLILAALGWVIDGIVEASTATTRVEAQIQSPALTMAPAIWHGVDASKPKPRAKLRGRRPAAKPDVLYWPDGSMHARLMLKFQDQYRVRLDPAGNPFSMNGQDIESLRVVLEGLQVSLERAYKMDESRLDAIINRAEMHSGKAQPDLAGTFYVNGAQGNVEEAAMVLLHDPRVEWAQFDNREDPRDAIQGRLTKPDVELPPAPLTTTKPAPPAFIEEAPKDPFVDPNPRGGGVPPTPGTAGACCLFGDDLVPAPMWAFNTNGGAVPINPPWASLAGASPLVINACDSENFNSTFCQDADGVFAGVGTQCNSTAIAGFIACSAAIGTNPDGVPWEPTGGCCTAGECDVLLQSECIASGGIFLHSSVTRYAGNSEGIPPTIPPTPNPRLNTQLVASLYGLTNFVVPDSSQLNFPFGTPNVNATNSNSSYTYYSSVPLLIPLVGIIYPNNLQVLNPPIIGTQILFEPTANNAYRGAVDGRAGVYRRGLVDFVVTDLGAAPVNSLGPAFGNGGAGGNNPLGISGGFTFGRNWNSTAGGGTIYNPNMFLACTDVSCEFGVCAIPCWDPTCEGIASGQNSASGAVVTPESPIMRANMIVPGQNTLCSNFFYEQACDQLLFRSSINDFNLTGSAYQDTWLGRPTFPRLAGCLSTNNPGVTEERWFRDFIDPASGVCCPLFDLDLTNGCEVELPLLEEGAGELRGDCLYSHLEYPTMLVDPAGMLQFEGAGFCYGTANPCPASCESEDLSATICGIAPICCDFEICADGVYNEPIMYSGWSFLCSDLANQSLQAGDSGFVTWPILPPTLATGSDAFYTDFDQALRVNGPYPQYNPLNLTTPYPRNLDGSIDFTDYNGDGLVPDPQPAFPKCMINYGIQNQCFTSYFSPYQPSLSLAEDAQVGPFGHQQQGCADFECCIRVCGILQPDPETGFNYQSCCIAAWGEECVEKAQEICYTNRGGTVTSETPNFVPLQFNLSQKRGRGSQAIGSFDLPLRRLVTAPLQPPSVLSPIPGDPTFTPDNWLQSAHQVNWVPNPDPLNAVTTFVAPSVRDVAMQYESSTGNVTPVVRENPNNWNQFYYGDPPSSPVPWYSSEGLTLHGNAPGQGWPMDPSFLSPSFGLYSWGQFMADLTPGFHPWGAHVNGTAGAGIKVAVLDYAAWVQEYIDDAGNGQGAIHEDLGNIIVEGPDLGYPPVKMLFDSFVTQPQRGTAVLGTIAASINNFGVSGISPQATTMFFPVVSADTGLRETDAWVHAIESLGFGDILIATYPGSGGTDCLYIDSATANDLIDVAAGNGITCVIPIGDSGQDVEGGLGATGGQALIAGASLPNNLPRRFWTSNFVVTADPGSGPIACSSAPIVTTGGDCNLTRIAIDTEPDTPIDPVGYISRDMMRRSYTNNFGNLFDGSRAGAAQVAAVAACLQGFCLQRYGIPYPPDMLKELIRVSCRTRSDLPGASGGDYPIAAFGGSGWQFDLDNTGVVGNVGGFLDPAKAGITMVIDPTFALDGSEYLYNFRFIRGLQQFGMIFSLEEVDQNYLIALSEPTQRGNYTPPFPVPGSPVHYLSTGQYVDLYVEGIEPIDRDIVGNMEVRTVIDVGLETTLTEAYLYSYLLEKWQYLPLEGGGAAFGSGAFNFNAVFPDQYFGNDGYFHIRIVTNTGMGGSLPGQNQEGFLIRYDLVDFDFSGVIGG